MAKKTKPETLYAGKFIQVVKKNNWEYVTRGGITGIVGIVAVTDDRKLVLIEQTRISVGVPVIELPAGLAGDTPGSEKEPLLNAAKRELMEETGYEAKKWKELAVGVTSAGLCDEVLTIFLATGIKKTGAAEGDGHEQITTHLVPLDKVESWLKRQVKAGKLVDLKVYSALHWAGV